MYDERDEVARLRRELAAAQKFSESLRGWVLGYVEMAENRASLLWAEGESARAKVRELEAELEALRRREVAP